MENKKPPPGTSGGFLENLELYQILIPQLVLPVFWTRQVTEIERELGAVALIVVEIEWIILWVTLHPVARHPRTSKGILSTNKTKSPRFAGRTNGLSPAPAYEEI